MNGSACRFSWSVSLLILLFLVPLQSQSATLSSNKGSDGVDFQVLPIDIRNQCSSVVLRGTRRFRGTAYLMPKAFISINRKRDQLFEILTLENGTYLLRMALYFPMNNEAFYLRKGMSHVNLYPCNFERVRQELERAEKATQKKSDDDSEAVVPLLTWLPATQVKVSVQGIDGKQVVAGSGANIINYQGLDHILEFPLENREQVNDIIQRLRGKIGLGINVEFDFSARTSDGVLEISIDLERLRKSLEVDLAGQANIFKGQLHTRIASLVETAHRDIYLESGDSEIFNRISENIINSIISNDPTVIDMKPTLPAAGGLPDPATTPPPTTPQTPQLDASVKLKVFYERLKEKKTENIRFQAMSGLQTMTYHTSMMLKGHFEDPGVRELRAISQDPNPPSFPMPIMKGDTVAFFPFERVEEDISYRRVSHYFSKEDLPSIEKHVEIPLHEEFHRLHRNMDDFQEYSSPLGWIAYLRDGGVPFVRAIPGLGFGRNYHLWGYELNKPFYKRVKVSQKMSNDRTEEFYKENGILSNLAVSFSVKGGKLFLLSDLIETNKIWGGGVDDETGKVIIEAYKDLGTLRVHNLETFSAETAPVKLFFEMTVKKLRDVGNPDKMEKSYANGQLHLEAEFPSKRSIYKIQVLSKGGYRSGSLGAPGARITATLEPSESSDGTLGVPPEQPEEIQ